jgi:hypothetical protein
MAEPIATPREERGWYSSGNGVALLWAGLLCGPIAWAADLTASYAIVKWVCGSQHTWVLHLITLGALALTGGGALSAWIGLQHAPEGAALDGPRPFDRGRFMAVLGLVVSAMFALTIIANDIPRAVLDACL